MNRRDFLSAAAYVGSALVVGVSIPRGFLGDPAGGFYAPIPKDLGPYLHDRGERDSSVANHRIHIHALYALWAPPGAIHGALALFAGTTLRRQWETPVILAAKDKNRNNSMRALLERHHEPGWFLVRTTRETGALDLNGEPAIESVETWKRVGYLKWMTREDMSAITRAMYRDGITVAA